VYARTSLSMAGKQVNIGFVKNNYACIYVG